MNPNLITLIVLSVVILLDIMIIRYIIKRSYYFTKNEASILRFALKRQTGKISAKKHLSILRKLNKNRNV